MIQIDHTKCAICKTCTSAGCCPVASFSNDMTGMPPDCIECMHCVAGCPNGAVSFNNMVPVEQTTAKIVSTEFEQLLAQRRTHREFSSQPVEAETIRSFISHLRFSPTASNNQNLEFTVITDKQLIAQLNETVIDTIRTKFNQSLNTFTYPLVRAIYGKKAKSLYDAKNKFIKKAAFKHDMITYNAPVVVLLHAQVTPTGMPMLNAGIWTGMALLYAETLNLATCVNGYVVNALSHNKHLANSLGIPHGHKVFSCILLGHRKRKYVYKVNRKEPVIRWLS